MEATKYEGKVKTEEKQRLQKYCVLHHDADKSWHTSDTFFSNLTFPWKLGIKMY